MVDIFLVPVAILYLIVVGMMSVYGMNFFHMTYISWKRRDCDAPGSSLPGAITANLSRVTVQTPIYNERYVAERLIDAVARLDYPAHLLEIQVLDDSTDDTCEIARAAVRRWQSQGIDIRLMHRENRQGYKAGALAAGLRQAKGQYVAVFDADFVPPADFLRLLLPHFDDPRVAFVQARWGHLNRDYSLLTFLQSLSIDAHFMIEQFARSQAGYWFNFNGTAGIWRRAAIEDAGGWKGDTLTEDLDLSYRAHLQGWQARYVRSVSVPAELPVSFNAYRRQQQRWSRGSLQCAVKFLPRVWKQPISLMNKIQASLHLTGYCVHLLLFALMLLYPLVLRLSVHYPSLIGLFGIGLFFNVTAFAPTAFFTIAQHQLKRRWLACLPFILFMSILGTGMMLNTVRSALLAVFGRSSIFERTPKSGISQKAQEWRGTRYLIQQDWLPFLELAFAIFNLGVVWYAMQIGNWIIAAYALIFCLGLTFASTYSILQTLATIRYRAARRHRYADAPLRQSGAEE